jgi:hypothetical protein
MGVLRVLCVLCVLCIKVTASTGLPLYGGAILDDDSLTSSIVNTTNNVQCVEVIYNTAYQLTIPFVSLVLCVLSAIIMLL